MVGKLVGRMPLAHILLVAAFAVAAATALPRAGYAQQVAATSSDKSGQRVTIDLDGVPLVTALQKIAREAGLRLAFDATVLPAKTRVTLHLRDVSVPDAFTAALTGTGFAAIVRATRNVTIERAVFTQPQLGIIIGTITSADTRRGMARATVSVVGTKIATLTDANGKYTLANVPAGVHRIAARILGYAASDREVTVRGNDTVTADFALLAIATRLREVVTTGSGDQRRLEVGNSIETIDAASIVPNTPIRNLSDLLNSRAAGTQVSSTSGAVGSGSQVRIRGVASVLGSADPIVIVDGIRLDASFSQPITGAPFTNVAFGNAQPRSAASNISTGAPVTSRLNDINPEDIEKVEILKGPSAATLYGSDAANGVIVVTTKRGRPGPTRWSVFGQHGTSRIKATFPDAWFGWGSNFGQPNRLECSLNQEAIGLCHQDSVTHFNPLNDEATSILGVGHANKFGTQVSGGNAQLRYFVSGDYNNEIGLQRLSPYDAATYTALRNGAALPDWVMRPNTLNALHLTSNFTTVLSPKAEVTLSSRFLHQYHRDDAGSYFIARSVNSNGYRDSATGGWGAPSPGETFLTRSSDIIDRGNGGLNGRWDPINHVSGRGTVGLDFTNRTDDGLTPTNILPNMTGAHSRSEMRTIVRTVDLGGTLDLPIGSNLRARSSVGEQYTRTDINGVVVSATGLAPGSDVVDNATMRDASEFKSAEAVAGWYIEQSLALNERAFITGAVRGDASSSFGSGAKAVYYPKWSASWLISQEPFFPHLPGMNNLRLRAAFGHAGVQPPIDARFRSFKSSTGYVNNGSIPAFIVSTVGNTKLRPERSTELEGGFDLGWWDDRLTFDLTTYRKLTRDALIDRELPPSVGKPTRQENIGTVENRGLEITATVRPISSSFLNWTAAIRFSQNRNRLVTLGSTTLPGISNHTGTNESRYVVGYPLNGFWDRPILGYADVNENGIIEPSEVRIGDSAVYRGQPFPKADVSWHNDLSFFSGWVNLSAGLNYVGGVTQLNAARLGQCQPFTPRCPQLQDRNTSLADQAYAVAYQVHLSDYNGTSWGFLERGSYLRLSELSLTFQAPQAMAARLRAHTASVSIMGRNLALWSKYKGADPEVNTNLLGNQLMDGGGVPQPRDWSIRINLGY